MGHYQEIELAYSLDILFEVPASAAAGASMRGTVRVMMVNQMFC